MSTFLIVEDSPTMVQLYKMVLGGLESTELIFAANGLEALDLLAQARNVDLLIVDINMPQMNGIEFLQRAEEELGAGSIPSVVISTEGAESDRQAAFEAGANAYLQKPWTPPELLDTVASLLAPRETS